MSSSQTGGVASYRGYEYQIIVSAWVALELMLRRGLCSAIDVEPASQEDVAAKLEVPAESADTSLIAKGLEGPIYIQIKHRSSFWNEGDFVALLKTREKRGTRGPQPRERALARLQAEKSLRYLLITDAEVHPNLKSLIVVEIGERSSAVRIDDLTSVPDEASRVGILEKRVMRYVEKDIDDILEQVGFVPAGRAPACREELVQAIRKRLLGERESQLPLLEVESIIERCGGRPQGSGYDFVKPANYAELEGRLEAPPHALLLVGSPGIGKTTVAYQLIDTHRRKERPFEVLESPRPHEVRAALRRSGRVLVYLEDPWGRYKLEQDANLWTDELPRLIAGARGNPDKRFLITSRTGLLVDAVGLLGSEQEREKVQQTLGAYVASINEEHFDAAARLEILKRRMRGGHRRQRDWVGDRAATIIGRLTVPQAIVSFTDRLKHSDSDQDINLDALLEESQVEALGGVVARQVRELDATMSAVVLWAFLTTSTKLTDALARDLSVWLGEEAGLDVDVPRLISFLVASGWLSRESDRIKAHPNVIAGLEKTLDAEKAKSDRVLRSLLEVLVRNSHMRMATQIMLGLQGRRLPVPAQVQEAIDAYLRTAALNADDRVFPGAVDRLSRLSRAMDPVSMIARALSTVREHSSAVETWEPPSWSPEELDTVRSSPQAELLARRYVRLVYVEARIFVGEDKLLAFLSSLNWDLSKEFADAALEALEREGSYSDLLWKGALSGVSPPYEDLMTEVLAAYDSAVRHFETSGRLLQDRAEEGELDAEYAGHVLDDPSEQFYAPESALRQIVASRREREGYQWFLEHPRKLDLMDAWADAMPSNSGGKHEEELRALAGICPAHSRASLWKAIGRTRCRALVNLVLKEIASAPNNQMTCCLSALFGMYAPEEIGVILEPTLRDLAWPRRAALIAAVRGAGIPDPGDHMHRDPEMHRRAVYSLLGEVEANAMVACAASDSGEQQYTGSPLDEQVLEKIALLSSGEDQKLAALACVVLVHHRYPVTDAAQRLLSSDDKMTRLHSLRALAKVEPLPRKIFLSTLNDGYYQCRRFAMWALSKDASPEEQRAIFAMAKDPSAPVREACARLIGDHQWQDGLGTVLELLADRRDRSANSSFTGGVPDYHVARRAAEALGRFKAPLSKEATCQVLEILRRAKGACDDPGVHHKLLGVAAVQSDPAVPNLLHDCLMSDWSIGPAENRISMWNSAHVTEAFPLRYAAAWGWVARILRFPNEGERVAVTTLADAAGHSDERLAAPALLAMGLIWKRSCAQIEQLLGGELMTEERVTLIEAGARFGQQSTPDELLGGSLPSTHPARRLLAWCWEQETDDEAWKRRLAGDEGAQSWLERIRNSTPVHAVLRHLLAHSPRGALIQELKCDDFRNGELIEGVPLLTTFHFAGLE
ncbi:hypothetical protein WME89_48970 [Sorangium sp. So ce321]|uniref:HEAT repeat domain-containing protein n=1 Tax=Sorangium sp. So ce321 TaxID=3133300 RepID=UPI003F636910